MVWQGNKAKSKGDSKWNTGVYAHMHGQEMGTDQFIEMHTTPLNTRQKGRAKARYKKLLGPKGVSELCK